MTVTTELTAQHRDCDALFAKLEAALRAADPGSAAEALARFRTDMLAHFALEEDILFPAFEDATGMRQGPTVVMRTEHADMRDLLDEMASALAAADFADALGQGETLLVLMQQHNMKEENILYPMLDARVSGAAALLGRKGA